MAPRVRKLSADHELRAFTKRCLDLRSRKAWTIPAVSSTPEGSCKGQEQVASFHRVGGALKAPEVRVLATALGKPSPESPITVSGWIVISVWFLRIEKAAEIISVRGWTSTPGAELWMQRKATLKFGEKVAIALASVAEPLLVRSRGKISHKVALARPVLNVVRAPSVPSMP